MKSNLTLGIVCAALSLVGAAPAGDLEDQAYDEGWDAAREFCQDVEEDEISGAYEKRDITERFEKNCKQGFDAYINNNRSCKKKLQKMEDGYKEMWRARRQSCT